MMKSCIYLLCLVPALATAQEAVRPRPVSVESTSLRDVGPWGAASLPLGLAPLSSDLWRGADPGTLGVLFSRITPDQRFPSLQSLTRQAIFSGGTAPTTDPDVTRGRFEAANRFGPADATLNLIFGVPRLASQADLAAIAIDAGLRVGQIDRACNLIEAVVAPSQSIAGLEARATCYALNDEAAAANLSVDLAKTQGLTDTWLGRAIAAVAGPLTAPPPFRSDSGRSIALSLRAKLKPPLNLVANQDPMALSSLIGNGDFMAMLAPEERLALARNGASRGVVPLATLASFIPAPLPVPVTTPVSEPVSGPVSGPNPAPASPQPPGTAPLTPPPASLPPVLPQPAQITLNILSAPSLALRAVEARLAFEDIKTIMATQPGLMSVTDVPILVEAALWNRDGVLATSIAKLLPSALDPRLALTLALYDPARQAQSIETRIDAAGGDISAKRIAMRDALVGWSAGLPIGGGLSLLVQTGLPWGQAGNAGLRAALELAGNRGSKGEVILLTALALQGVDPQSIDGETLVAGIRALARVGLSDASRDLARDYLLATFVTLPSRPRVGGVMRNTPASTTALATVAAPKPPQVVGPLSGPVSGQIPALVPPVAAQLAPALKPRVSPVLAPRVSPVLAPANRGLAPPRVITAPPSSTAPPVTRATQSAPFVNAPPRASLSAPVAAQNEPPKNKAKPKWGTP